MNVLVTGANGLIGANLCRALIKSGYRVRALVRKSSDLTAIQGLSLDLVYGDVLNPETLYGAAEGCEIVFHAAAVFAYWGVADSDLERVAVEGTSNMMVAARAASVRRFVLTSSSVVFGFSTYLAVRTEADQPDDTYSSPYCLSKLHQERAEQRRSQIGSGDRSERIRTYNFPQNRCTDHRLGGEGGGEKNFNLDQIMQGLLDPLLNALLELDKQQRLENL